MGNPESEQYTQANFIHSLLDLILACTSTVTAAGRGLEDAEQGAADNAGLQEAMGRFGRAREALALPSFDAGSPTEYGLANRFTVQSALRYAQEMQFKTNDIVVVECRDWYGARWLRISGLRPIRLRLRAYLLVSVLVKLALKRPGEFISCSDLIEEIEDLASGLTNPRGDPLWITPVEADLYKEVSILKQEIEARGGNPKLVEGVRGHGYRLSTSPWNLYLSSPGAEADSMEG